MKNRQLNKIWKSEFGNEYTDRLLKVHETEGGRRKNFWDRMINSIDNINSVTEIGCNAGMNLEGIFNANSKLRITGVDPNNYALKKAKEIANSRYNVIKGDTFDLSSIEKSDLVITCTVLIHISPDNLINAMKNIIELSNNYILIMEYYWPIVKELEYRGLNNALWKRDYGHILMDNFEVNLLETGYLDDRDGFDRVTWWLFNKTDSGSWTENEKARFWNNSK